MPFTEGEKIEASGIAVSGTSKKTGKPWHGYRFRFIKDGVKYVGTAFPRLYEDDVWEELD